MRDFWRMAIVSAGAAGFILLEFYLFYLRGTLE
jgi:hypothetical protein